MVFGEIIEPSSRALWEDDFVEYPDDDEPELQWNGVSAPPEIVNKLFIGESSRILTLLQKCVLGPTKPLCELVKAGIRIYKVENDSYVVTYKTEPDVIVGKITQKLIPWLKAAKNTFVLTSGPITLFQSHTYTETSCIIRSLSSKNSQCGSYSKLEVPNLVTGLSASILSYCIHSELACILYISFFEEVALDSLNTQPFLDLLRYLKISQLTGYTLEKKSVSSNLYM